CCCAAAAKGSNRASMANRQRLAKVIGRIPRSGSMGGRQLGRESSHEDERGMDSGFNAPGRQSATCGRRPGMHHSEVGATSVAIILTALKGIEDPFAAEAAPTRTGRTISGRG